MATDVYAAVSGNLVKNGTTIVSTTKTGEYSTIEYYVQNTPTISGIESKWDNRFDDPSYYYGSNLDGSGA